VTVGAAVGLLVVLAGVAARRPGMLRALGGNAPSLPEAVGPDAAVDPGPA
jgi:hypothetical protein